MAKRTCMLKKEYTVEEKKEFVMAYLKERQSLERVDYKTLVEWTNEKYELKDKLNKYDFLEPEEMREWMQMLNTVLMVFTLKQAKKEEK